MDVNNTAISKHSLNLQDGDGYTWSLAHDKIKATGVFSYLFWFKANGQPDAYSQLLSKKEDGYSSYFVQVEPDGLGLKTILRSYGTYYDNGVIPFQLDKWHQLVLLMMAQFLILFWMVNGWVILVYRHRLMLMMENWAWEGRPMEAVCSKDG